MLSYLQIRAKYSHTFSMGIEIRANIYGENGIFSGITAA